LDLVSSNDKLDIDLFCSIGHHNKVKMALTLHHCTKLFKDLTSGVEIHRRHSQTYKTFYYNSNLTPWKFLFDGSLVRHLRSISSTFYERFLYESAFCRQNVTREKHFCTKNTCEKCWWNWHLGSILPSCLSTFLSVQIPKEQKDSHVIGIFFHFCDLGTQKLFVKHCWNWHLQSSSLNVFFLLPSKFG